MYRKSMWLQETKAGEGKEILLGYVNADGMRESECHALAVALVLVE